MRPAFLALAGAAALSTAFAAAQALAFVAMMAVPVAAVGIADAHATDTPPALYRWTEPDGSLTFSPTAPTDGTSFQRVDPMTMRPVDAASDGAPRPSSGITSPERPASAPARVSRTSSGSGTFTDPAPATNGTARPLPSPALGAAARLPAGAGESRATGPAAVSPGVSGSRIVASNDKARRCGDLGKRVVSLERRLTTPLTPDAMDETVVQIARYQRSVERYCR